METNNLTEQEIKDLIIKFNLDESINDLKKYYATPTTWDIINQSRKETRHTQFLAWFFGNKDFNADPNAGPIKKLIVLLLKWANMQASAEYDEALANSIYSQNLSILSYNVIAEFPIFIKRPSEHTPAYEEGDIDIVIKCTAMVNDVERNINIVIENKIGSPETIKCFDKDGKRLDKPNKNNDKTVLYQTEAYYQYITKKYKDDINIFAFLKPTDCKLKDIKRAKCKCDKYIQINYQELLDNIIQPVSDQKDISVENRYRLKDYIKTLGKPAGNDILQGIVTLPAIRALEISPDRDELRQIVTDRNMTPEMVQRALEIVRASDGIEFTRKKVEEFLEGAVAALPEEMPEEIRESYRMIVSFVGGRKF